MPVAAVTCAANQAQNSHLLNTLAAAGITTTVPAPRQAVLYNMYRTTNVLGNSTVGVPASNITYPPPVFAVNQPGPTAQAPANKNILSIQQLINAQAVGKPTVDASVSNLVPSNISSGPIYSPAGLPSASSTVLPTSSGGNTGVATASGNKQHVPPLHLYTSTSAVSASRSESITTSSPTFSPPHKKVDIDQFSNILGLKKVDEAAASLQLVEEDQPKFDFESMAGAVLSGLERQMTMAQRKSATRNKPPKKTDHIPRIVKEVVRAEIAKNPRLKLPVDIDDFAKSVHYRYMNRAIRKSTSRNAPPSQGELGGIIKTAYECMVSRRREAEKLSLELAEDHSVLTKQEIWWLNMREHDCCNKEWTAEIGHPCEYDYRMAEIFGAMWSHQYQPSPQNVKKVRDLVASKLKPTNKALGELLVFLANEADAQDVDKIVAKYLLLYLIRNKKENKLTSPSARDLFIWRIVGKNAVLASKGLLLDPKWILPSAVKHGSVVPSSTAFTSPSKLQSTSSHVTTNSDTQLSQTLQSKPGRPTKATAVSFMTAVSGGSKSDVVMASSTASKPSVIKIGPIPRTTPTTVAADSANKLSLTASSTATDPAVVWTPVTGISNGSVQPLSSSAGVFTSVNSRPITVPVKAIPAPSRSSTGHIDNSKSAMQVSVIKGGATTTPVKIVALPKVTVISPTAKKTQDSSSSESRPRSAEPSSEQEFVSPKSQEPRPASVTGVTSPSEISVKGFDTVVRRGKMTLNLGASKASLLSVSKFDMTSLKELPGDLQELQKIITKTITKPKITLRRVKVIQGEMISAGLFVRQVAF